MQIEGDVFLVDAPLRGKAALTIDENWTLSTSGLTLDGTPVSLDLNQDGGRISSVQMDIPNGLNYVPLFEIPEDIKLNGLRANWSWEGTWEQWVVNF
ncbi:hypothetical protein N9K46_03635, partial [Schleiferiaceae bacterium]|nr:hypothetical protein [Schleiferiaceae bacterium]